MASHYSGWFDLDGWPLAFVQAGMVYLSVHRYGDSIAWREHRTARAAKAQAVRDRGIAVAFNIGRWEQVPS